ncbi:glycosyltransferase family 4 protein [Shewanella baltica]|uniref:glycosyltransferase family 4 protein n=1 Tax=Shewanella baltica TaxID=62322 RepID=UPI003CFDB24B
MEWEDSALSYRDIKKVAFVCNISLMAGAQRIALEIMKGMPSDWEKYIFVGRDEIGVAEFEKCFSEVGAKIIYVDSLKREISKNDIVAFWELFKLFRKHNFDIVHSHSTKPGILARIAAKLAGTEKVIHTVHGIAYNTSVSITKRLLYYTIECIATLFGSKLILVNNYYYKYYRFFNIKGNVTTIHNGVDFDKLNQLSEIGNDITLNYSKSKKHILFVGRLDVAKSPVTLLKSVSYLKAFFPQIYNDIIVDIAGDGDLAAACKEFVHQNDLGSVVRFHGWINGNEKNMLYKQAYLFCCPSIFEAFGLVFVEAGYYGLPVISTTVEGIPEVVCHNVSGILVEPNDHVALATAMLNIIQNEELRKTMSSNALNICTQKFDINIMRDKYMEIYCE